MNKNSIYEIVLPMLTKKRLKHTEGVRDTALELCEIYNVDKDKAEIASICHDIFRGKTNDEINELVFKWNLDSDRYLNNPNLAHGKLAKCFVQKELGIDDEDILNAVSYHTTGRKNMSILEKIVFIADAIEPGRDYPGVEEIRNVVAKDIDHACLLSLRNTVNHLLEQGKKKEEIDIDTLEAIDYFEKEK